MDIEQTITFKDTPECPKEVAILLFMFEKFGFGFQTDHLEHPGELCLAFITTENEENPWMNSEQWQKRFKQIKLLSMISLVMITSKFIGRSTIVSQKSYNAHLITDYTFNCNL